MWRRVPMFYCLSHGTFSFCVCEAAIEHRYTNEKVVELVPNEHVHPHVAFCRDCMCTYVHASGGTEAGHN